MTIFIRSLCAVLAVLAIGYWLLRDDLGLSRQEAGSFLSAFYVGGALTSFPAGWLADRLGVRWTLLAGQGVVAIGFALMTLAPGYSGLLAAVVLAGVVREPAGRGWQ